MSQLLINRYLSQLAALKKVSGTARETVVREAFKDLLKSWGRSQDLVFVPEYEVRSSRNERRYVDGALLHALRVPFGFWEAKDAGDDLDKEIEKKFSRGYPKSNIIFEDTRTAVLIQEGLEVCRCRIDETVKISALLSRFFSYERPEISEFRKAVEQFKFDLPDVLESLRSMIDGAYRTNLPFEKAARKFLRHIRRSVNAALLDADVREMLIQHVLTEEIFSKVFSDSDFHSHNNIAMTLYELEELFFVGKIKKNTLRGLAPYYASINAAAAQISSHKEKQLFLKVIYGSFYKVYNIKAADRLGVVYTPNDIVRFMVEASDFLCEKNFDRSLCDKGVEILDPATGTGTFITELLEFMSGQKKKLSYKYQNELFANEVAILPYYVANLNIEATYAALMDTYSEFPNLCFVDTIDNTAGLRKHAGHQADLFGSISEENVDRIKRQNERTISVIIGNPPYNANQLNENEDNKNRTYPEIDRRIKATYIKRSTAQKTKLYDMYVRFLRWASDRIAADGIVAFVSNSSFIDSKTFDGFRKIVEEEFNEIYVIDLKGNARTTGVRRRREGGNIFENKIRVGVAVYFLVKRRNAKGCKIYYEAVGDYENADEKLAFLAGTPLGERPFELIRPDRDGDWINQSDADYLKLTTVIDKLTKSTKGRRNDSAIFKTFGNGVNTARDEWVMDFDARRLEKKVKNFLSVYDRHASGTGVFDINIKWSRNLKSKLKRMDREKYQPKAVRRYAYRPFVDTNAYLSKLLIDEMGALGSFDIPGNITINVPAAGEFYCLASDKPTDFHFTGDTRQFARWRLDGNGAKVDNITEWALDRFQKRYGDRKITKDAIFAYAYGTLHDPLFRARYRASLIKQFPRLPDYADFWFWSEAGAALLVLHVRHREAKAWPLQITGKRSVKAGAVFRIDRSKGYLSIGRDTRISRIPEEAWEYKLGSRSAIGWMVEMNKRVSPKDESLARLIGDADFKTRAGQFFDDFARICTVSVETVKLQRSMELAGVERR